MNVGRCKIKINMCPRWITDEISNNKHNQYYKSEFVKNTYECNICRRIQPFSSFFKYKSIKHQLYGYTDWPSMRKNDCIVQSIDENHIDNAYTFVHNGWKVEYKKRFRWLKMKKWESCRRW